uniref:Uncharacterized protein n=1 Tax=Romanomermis culicivorax TaxID=13658 RepID=A0A915HFH9_ROMCU
MDVPQPSKVLLHDPALEPYPPGMMAIHFNTEGEIDKEDKNIIILHMTNAMHVLNAGLDSYLRNNNYPMTFASTSNCNSDVNFTWTAGDDFYKHLKKVKVRGKTGVSDHSDITIEFDDNGFLKETYLTILNLKPDKKWEN